MARGERVGEDWWHQELVGHRQGPQSADEKERRLRANADCSEEQSELGQFVQGGEDSGRMDGLCFC